MSGGGIFGRPPKPGVDFFPGVLPGVPRSTFSGTLASNTTYTNLNFGNVTVRGLSNVTFVNCSLYSQTYSNGSGWRLVNGFSNSSNPTAFNIQFHDCTLHGANVGIAGPAKLYRCHVLNQGDDNWKPDQATASNPAYAEDCWFERMGLQTDESPHADAVQVQGAGWVTFRRCNFDHPYPGSPQWQAKMANLPPGAVSGAVGAPTYRSNAIWQEDADDPNSNVLFEDCWVNGGNTTFNMRGLGGSNRILRRIYVGEQNANWDEGRERVRQILLNGPTVTAEDWFWDVDNEPVAGITQTGGTPPPPPPIDPNWRRMVLRVS